MIHWKNARQLLTASALSLLYSGSALSTEAVLIGGGYNVHGSQGQIELNVKWVQSILETQNITVDTYFTDGDEPGADVHYVVVPEQGQSRTEPLARVFYDWVLENRRYREHSVPNVLGSTRRNELEPKLRDIIERTDDQDLLLVYNGHGSQSMTTPDRVTLNLWDDTTLTARELHEMLEPRTAPFRFVFTQCYSGGFHRLAYKESQKGLELNSTPRCGFTAESAYRLAEGCSASIDTDDYRDYTTYFFAALAGEDRNGQATSHNPDANKDGITTLREAHLYTLEQAVSTDLSRSTSEDYLDQWQPWYLRWLPSPAILPDNEYSRMFAQLASQYEIDTPVGTAAVDTAAGAAPAAIRQKLALNDQQQQATIEQRHLLENQIGRKQIELQLALMQHWPELMGPYTGAYQTLASNGSLLLIADQISQMPDYSSLVEAQTQFADLDLELLEQERLGTQLHKLIRLRQLALLKQQISEYGSNQEQLDYHSLVACEDTPLTP
ncbi:hypothetical protein [Granulosicoccus antarcticus]|uniref:Caspase family p20 domain-containing protein n=1 Tax=Granulosicoccus antarcticus IMCC3135 TaxID=1192854 RepID=A0A2Z2NGQ1_9GAMM|nr:hypothetical protein [Granulosicoccus antarcticus]ASJ70243.1 hypothetical protein IMCC3135_00585 [Granulosicoccus antarcticus IMCC3135]